MRHVLARLGAVAAGATLTAGLALTAPAAALAATPVFAPASHAHQAHGAGFNINGYNWGGYAATGSGFTSVTATWTEPSVTCNSTNDLYAPWVGIDGYGSNTVEQTGVATDCSSGRPVYQAWYEMYPASPVYLSLSSYPVAAGNSFTGTVTFVGSSKFTLTLVNNSRGWTYTITKKLSSARRLSAEVIIESPTGAYPNFGSVTFTNAKVNGNTLGSYNPVAMDPSANGVYEAHASALSGGTSFSMTYQHE
jgi:Peptidase A4 family